MVYCSYAIIATVPEKQEAEEIEEEEEEGRCVPNDIRLHIGRNGLLQFFTRDIDYLLLHVR